MTVDAIKNWHKCLLTQSKIDANIGWRKCLLTQSKIDAVKIWRECRMTQIILTKSTRLPDLYFGLSRLGFTLGWSKYCPYRSVSFGPSCQKDCPFFSLLDFIIDDILSWSKFKKFHKIYLKKVSNPLKLVFNLTTWITCKNLIFKWKNSFFNYFFYKTTPYTQDKKWSTWSKLSNDTLITANGFIEKILL
jgi:hypothetical protein